MHQKPVWKLHRKKIMWLVGEKKKKKEKHAQSVNVKRQIQKRQLSSLLIMKTKVSSTGSYKKGRQSSLLSIWKALICPISTLSFFSLLFYNTCCIFLLSYILHWEKLTSFNVSISPYFYHCSLLNTRNIRLFRQLNCLFKLSDIEHCCAIKSKTYLNHL